MRLQREVKIENQRKTNSEKHDTYNIFAALWKRRNGFAYNMNKLLCELNNTSETDTKNNTSLTRVLTR